MRGTVIPLALLVLVLPGWGSARQSAPRAADSTTVVASIDPSQVSANIIGAAPKQETILREILAGLGRDTRITSVRVLPAGKANPDSVAVDPHVAPGEAVRGDWEVSLLANAFAARSRAVHLPRVAELFVNGESDSSLDAGDPVEQRDQVTAEALSRDVISGAKKSGAQLVELELLHPDNYALAVKLQVDDPASFLDQRAPRFLSTVPMPDTAHYDGLFIEIVDAKGKLAWSYSLAVSEDGGGMSWGYIRPELAGCEPIHSFGGSPFKRPPPPCPVKTAGEPSDQSSSSDVTTKIVGATQKQEAVLREILAGLGQNVIDEIRVAKAGHEWTPYHANSVVVHLRTAKTEENGRAEWEAALVAEAFQARSRADHVQPVAAYETAVGGSALDGPDPPADKRTPITEKEIEDGIVRGAKESGAEIAVLHVANPLHLAVAVTLRVDDPAAYLKHRLVTFLNAIPSADRRRYDGLYVLVTDRNGKYVWLSAQTVGETLSGGEVGARADLQGCDPIPRFGSATDKAPPPCPVD